MPDNWARQTVKAFFAHKAEKQVGENQMFKSYRNLSTSAMETTRRNSTLIDEIGKAGGSIEYFDSAITVSIPDGNSYLWDERHLLLTSGRVIDIPVYPSLLPENMFVRRFNAISPEARAELLKSGSIKGSWVWNAASNGSKEKEFELGGKRFKEDANGNLSLVSNAKTYSGLMYGIRSVVLANGGSYVSGFLSDTFSLPEDKHTKEGNYIYLHTTGNRIKIDGTCYSLEDPVIRTTYTTITARGLIDAAGGKVKYLNGEYSVFLAPDKFVKQDDMLYLHTGKILELEDEQLSYNEDCFVVKGRAPYLTGPFVPRIIAGSNWYVLPAHAEKREEMDITFYQLDRNNFLVPENQNDKGTDYKHVRAVNDKVVIGRCSNGCCNVEYDLNTRRTRYN